MRPLKALESTGGKAGGDQVRRESTGETKGKKVPLGITGKFKGISPDPFILKVGGFMYCLKEHPLKALSLSALLSLIFAFQPLHLEAAQIGSTPSSETVLAKGGGGGHHHGGHHHGGSWGGHHGGWSHHDGYRNYGYYYGYPSYYYYSSPYYYYSDPYYYYYTDPYYYYDGGSGIYFRLGF